jgi:hypothetical protein
MCQLEAELRICEPKSSDETNGRKNVPYGKKILAMSVVAGLSVTGPASALDDVSLRLHWLVNGSTLAWYLGMERGYFEEVGINLTISEGLLRIFRTPEGNSPVTFANPANDIISENGGTFALVLAPEQQAGAAPPSAPGL